MERKDKMKKKITVLSSVLVLSLVLVMLVSCGNTKLSGTYTKGRSIAGLGGSLSYSFSGDNNVKITLAVSGGKTNSEVVYEGTYEITETDSGSRRITFYFDDTDADPYVGEHKLVTGKDDDGKYIKIDGVRFDYAK